MRGIKSILGSAILVVGAVVAFGAINSTAQARDCSANSVVKCGTYSMSELRKKFNESKSVRNIFSYFGMNSTTLNKSYKNGYVTKNGTVTVGGKVVASGAVTAGRQSVGGTEYKKSVGGTTFYTRKTSNSFRSPQLSAFVFFNKDGTFAGAVIKDCGNPVKATNKVVPPKPPKPPVKKIKVCDLKSKKIVEINEKDFNKSKHSKNLKDCEQKPPVKPTNPGVSIDKKVDGVESKQVAVNQVYNYELTVKNTGDVDLTNVKVSDPAPTNVEFISADTGTITGGNQWTYTIPTLKVGESKDFTIKARVTKEVEGSIKNTACVDAPQVPGSPDDCDDATVVVPPKPERIEVCVIDTKEVKVINKEDFDESKHTTDLTKCDTPEEPVTPKPETPKPEVPAELPKTGAGDIVSAGLGLGAVIAAVSYYVASRRLLG